MLLTRQLNYLQSPNHPPYVLRRNALCTLRVKTFETLVHGQGTKHLGLGLESFTHNLVGGGKVQFVQCCSNVEHASANQNRSISPLKNLPNSFVSELGILDRSQFLIGSDNVNQMMRDSTTRLFSKLGCPDVHTLIELHGVSIDNLRISNCLGNRDTQIRLS